MKIAFVCPSCKATRIEEVLTDVIEYSEITGVEVTEDVDNTPVFYYGETSHEGGELGNYQCMECGFVIPEVHTPNDLHEWLKNNKMLLPD